MDNKALSKTCHENVPDVWNTETATVGVLKELLCKKLSGNVAVLYLRSNYLLIFSNVAGLPGLILENKSMHVV